MVRHSLHIDRAQLHGLGMDEARKLVRRVVRRTDNRSAVLAPVDTGNLRANRRSSVTDLGSVVVGEVVYVAEYAAAVHEGRRALTIRARRPGGRLKFTVGGRTVYARQVHQPARAGRPFLATALREVAAQEGFAVTIG
jgi:hypothetical protein